MSTTFIDGPAKDTTLELKRSPIFLRVVVDQDGKVDALDLLDDTPEIDEAVYVYKREGEVSTAMVCTRGPGGGCRTVSMATYRLYAKQPSFQVRDNDNWRDWVLARSKKGTT